MPELTDYLCKRSGEDPYIINICGHSGIRTRFALIGLIAMLVGALSFLSCWYSFKMLFDNSWIAIPVSFLFAWMINNIYEVLLTTLSKPVLKIKYQGVIKHLSLTLRIGFIVFFAVFISKPLEAWIFEPQLSTKVEALKSRQIAQAEKQIIKRTATAENNLLAVIRKKEQLRYDEKNIQPLKTELQKFYADRNEALDRVRFVVGRADYFVQRIEILTSSGFFMLSWLFTLLVIVLFLFPIYLKRMTKLSNPYFLEKRKVYEHIIVQEYKNFKILYSDFFWNRFQIDVEFTESYIDAPFNTEKEIEKRIFKSQNDFFEQFYS
jgi:hypothetical protein